MAASTDEPDRLDNAQHRLFDARSPSRHDRGGDFACQPTAEGFIKAFVIGLILTFIAGHAHAASCAAEANDKKLTGAAKTSFLSKCEKDASAACDKQAADRNLAGAAKASFTTKCVKDAVGN
jgi:hypothetical protein